LTTPERLSFAAPGLPVPVYPFILGHSAQYRDPYLVAPVLLTIWLLRHSI